MYHSITAVSIPSRVLAGHFLTFESRGSGVRLPSAYPGAFDIFVFLTSRNPGSISDEKYVANLLSSVTGAKLRENTCLLTLFAFK